MAAPLLSAARQVRPLAAVAAVAFVASGCSLSYNLGSMAGQDTVSPRASVAAPATVAARGDGANFNAGTQAANADMPAESDLVHARVAVAEAFSKGVSTRSTSWENPATGARGTITPLSTAYQQEGGGVCRDFLASYVRDGDETWLEGAACRGAGGRWTVKRLTPWKQA